MTTIRPSSSTKLLLPFLLFYLVIPHQCFVRATTPTAVCDEGEYFSFLTLNCELCPAGRYGSSKGLTSALCSGECPLGHFCPSGSILAKANKCPAGRYGSSRGLKTASCSGPCMEGHFCPIGSTSPRQEICGGPDYYCPQGTAQRLKAPAGYYTIPVLEEETTITNNLRMVHEMESHRIDKMTCEKGSWCVDGIRHPCPAGRYGSTRGLSTPQCSSTCPLGQFCPEGSTSPLPCPAGTYANVTGLDVCIECPVGNYCEAGTANPVPCPPGHYGGNHTGLQTAHCNVNCKVGETLDFQSTAACSHNLCPPGFHCPRGTIEPLSCPSEAYYCPLGSHQPIMASVGYYTVGSISVPGSYQSSDDSNSRFDQVMCEPGTYCIDGKRHACPPGTYGKTSGLSTALCSGICNAGYFCHSQSTSATRQPCGSPDFFCPSGSKTPIQVSSGYYSVDGGPSTRSAQVICPQGSYCSAGVHYPCPAGTYGDTIGLTSRNCSKTCAAGYYCPTGSIKATQLACPIGRFSSGQAEDAICDGLCDPGFHCSVGSDNAQEEECGGEEWYCPMGAARANVSAGAYAQGGRDSMTRSSEALCLHQILPAERQLSNNCPSNTQ